MLRYRKNLELTDHAYYTRYLKREFKRFEGEDPTRALIKKRYDKVCGKRCFGSYLNKLKKKKKNRERNCCKVAWAV